MQLVTIQNKIYEIKGIKVMLDFDLAELYEVETRVLNQAIKRNIESFPEDFMFRLTKEEWEEVSSSQSVMMSSQSVMTYKRPKSALPYVFTEHGVTMLASVLRSPKARKMNTSVQKICASSCTKPRTRIMPCKAPEGSLRWQEPNSARRSGKSR